METNGNEQEAYNIKDGAIKLREMRPDWSLEKIGTYVGVSSEAVRKILIKHGLPTAADRSKVIEEVPTFKVIKRVGGRSPGAEKFPGAKDMIIDLRTNSPELTIAEISSMCGLSKPRTSQIIREAGLTHPTGKKPEAMTQRERFVRSGKLFNSSMIDTPFSRVCPHPCVEGMAHYWIVSTPNLSRVIYQECKYCGLKAQQSTIREGNADYYAGYEDLPSGVDYDFRNYKVEQSNLV